MSRTNRKNFHYRPKNRYIRGRMLTFGEFYHSNVTRDIWATQNNKIYSYKMNKMVEVDNFDYETVYKYYEEYVNYSKFDSRDGNGLWSSAVKKIYSDNNKNNTRQDTRNKIQKLLKNPDLYDDMIFIETKWEANSYYGDEWIMW